MFTYILVYPIKPKYHSWNICILSDIRAIKRVNECIQLEGYSQSVLKAVTIRIRYCDITSTLIMAIIRGPVCLYGGQHGPSISRVQVVLFWSKCITVISVLRKQTSVQSFLAYLAEKDREIWLWQLLDISLSFHKAVRTICDY